jgi:hypothetical protein
VKVVGRQQYLGRTDARDGRVHVVAQPARRTHGHRSAGVEADQGGVQAPTRADLLGGDPKAGSFITVSELESVWSRFHCNHVYRTDSWTMLKSSLHWMAALVFGGFLVGMPRSLLDNEPLARLLKSQPWPGQR